MGSEKDFVICNGELVGYNGLGGDVVIPEGFTKISDEAFKFWVDLTSVSIPAGVAAIGEDAFAFCKGLTSVTIPESVTKIDKGAFSFCAGLKRVTIPKGIKELSKSAFYFSGPVVIVPPVPIGNFSTKSRPGAVCGFARLYMEKAEIDKEIRAEYLK